MSTGNSKLKPWSRGCSRTGDRKTKKKQKSYYSGKQKCHTIKSQVVANPKNRKIICIDCDQGKVHDFLLWKKSKIRLDKEQEFLGDKGYQGIQKLHQKSRTPHKKRKNKELTVEEKKANRQLAKERIIIEHIHRHLKRFRILSSRYRNRRKRLGLRLNLIAGIYNYELIRQ